MEARVGTVRQRPMLEWLLQYLMGLSSPWSPWPEDAVQTPPMWGGHWTRDAGWMLGEQMPVTRQRFYSVLGG